MRVELRDGQWAELREHITHGVDKQIKKARIRGKENAEDAFDWETVMVRSFVREWHVLDPDGAAIPLADEDAIDRAPDDIIDVLLPKAFEAYTGATVPNAPTPPSSDA